MKSKNFVVIVFFLLVFGNIVLISSVKKTKATSKEIFVDDDFYLFRDGTVEHPYGSIQYAIDVANPGDTIYVFGGTYNESLHINKRLTLVGGLDRETEGDTIVYYGKTHKYTVTISADNVNFKGFNVTDKENRIISELKGALIYVTADNVVIENNNITNSTGGYGVFLYNNKDCLINNNNISKVVVGVYSEDSDTNQIVLNDITECVTSCVEIKSTRYTNIFNNTLSLSYYGVFMRNCEYTEVVQNNISFNSLRAVRDYNGLNNKYYNNSFVGNTAEGLYLKADGSKVIGNDFINNPVGLRLVSSNCEIYKNYFNNSLSAGIICETSAKNNLIYYNYFYDNLRSAIEYGDNDWYNGVQGNIWDDYNDIDLDQDGIGDNPYTKNGVYDRYPLGVFLRPPNKPFNPVPKDLEDDTGLKITLIVNVTDPEGDLMDVYFYRITNNSVHTLLGSDTNVVSGESASISFNLDFDTIFVWYANVTDGRLWNHSDLWIFSTRARPTNNIPPVADAGGPYYAKVGESIRFNASGSSDEDGSVDYYRWNFGDDTSEILSTQPTHEYYRVGEFNVTLTVIDNDGASAIDITKVYVTYEGPQKPEAVITLPSSITAGKSSSFDASNSTDVDGSIVFYNWSFGDGSIASGETVQHTYTSPGTYIVTLTVTDNSGLSSSTSLSVTVRKGEGGTPGFEVLYLIIILLGFVVYKKLWSKQF